MEYPLFHGADGGSFSPATVDLGPTSYSRFDVVPECITTDQIGVVVIVSDSVWSWSHNRHVSFKHIEELRQLINARLPQPRPNPSDAAVTTHYLEDCRPVFLHRQRTKFQNLKAFAIKPMSGLHKQHRPSRIELYCKCDKEKEWQKKNESAYGAREIKQPLRNSLG